ncbi:MAG: hypothetical protein MSG64_07405 [Pyrinomonadaceae bacterium MAG19_C2-C3]|nr:hypothetical protein [Pyrinomonadaceae bacterium MAG19_C2-C3]
MLQKILLWLVRLVERRLDGDLDNELRLYQMRRQTVEYEIAKDAQRIKECESRLIEIGTQRASLQREVDVGILVIEELKSELEKIDEGTRIKQFEITHRSDSDVLRTAF